MRHDLRLLPLVLILGLLFAAISLTAWAQQGVDVLITAVNTLFQSGEITDARTVDNLVVSLQTIRSLLDAGDAVTARPLLVAFKTEVESLTGVGLTPMAVQTLNDEINRVTAGL